MVWMTYWDSGFRFISDVYTYAICHSRNLKEKKLVCARNIPETEQMELNIHFSF